MWVSVAICGCELDAGMLFIRWIPLATTGWPSTNPRLCGQGMLRPPTNVVQTVLADVVHTTLCTAGESPVRSSRNKAVFKDSEKDRVALQGLTLVTSLDEMIEACLPQ